MRRVMVVVLGAVMAMLGSAAGQSGSNESYSERYSASVSKKTHTGELVDINRASVDELMRVSGMTRVWANRIVRFRPYRMKTDLLERGILPDRVYDRIKDSVIAHKVEK